MRPLRILFLGCKLSGQSELAKPATSKAFDQTGLDQQPIEPPRLGTAGAPVEQAVTTLQDILLFGKGRIKRYTRRLLHQQRQVGCIERVKRRGKIDGLEIYGVDRIVAGVVARIEGFKLPRDSGSLSVGSIMR